MSKFTRSYVRFLVPRLRLLAVVILFILSCHFLIFPCSISYATTINRPMADAKVDSDFNFNQPLKLYLIFIDEPEPILSKMALSKLRPLLQQKGYQITDNKMEADIAVIIGVKMQDMERAITLNVFFYRDVANSPASNDTLILDAFAAKSMASLNYEGEINSLCHEIVEKVPNASPVEVRKSFFDPKDLEPN